MEILGLLGMMITVAVLSTIFGFMAAVWAADKVWKCCPCVDGKPDCTERDKARG